MDIALQAVVVLGLAEMLVGLVLIVRGQGESLAGLSREDIARRTQLKRVGLPLMASGALMAIGALVALRLG